MTEPVLDWTTANVKGRELTVDLDGEISSDWKSSFEATAKLLAGHSGWGTISVSKKRKTISVCDVSEGTEERLRACLEGAVEQANADHPTEEPDEDEDGDEQPGREVEEEADEPDAEMTERFRSFGD
jgi:hypothetical protein